MGNKLVPEEEKKVTKGVTLPNWMWTKIEKMGKRSSILQKILQNHLKKD